MLLHHLELLFFFFNDTATTEIYTLPLHDALPIWVHIFPGCRMRPAWAPASGPNPQKKSARRSEEHTSELQSQSNLVCRLLLEKKKKSHTYPCRLRIFSKTYTSRGALATTHCPSL